MGMRGAATRSATGLPRQAGHAICWLARHPACLPEGTAKSHPSHTTPAIPTPLLLPNPTTLTSPARRLRLQRPCTHASLLHALSACLSCCSSDSAGRGEPHPSTSMDSLAWQSSRYSLRCSPAADEATEPAEQRASSAHTTALAAACSWARCAGLARRRYSAAGGTKPQGLRWMPTCSLGSSRCASKMDSIRLRSVSLGLRRQRPGGAGGAEGSAPEAVGQGATANPRAALLSCSGCAVVANLGGNTSLPRPFTQTQQPTAFQPHSHSPPPLPKAVGVLPLLPRPHAVQQRPAQLGGLGVCRGGKRDRGVPHSASCCGSGQASAAAAPSSSR